MWRHLIFNGVWFAILFMTPFFRRRALNAIVVILIVSLAVFSAAYFPIDPFAWIFYFIFSWLIFGSAFQFRKWALARAVVLEEEIGLYSRKFEHEHEILERKREEARLVEKVHEDITLLYDKVKEMSQSLDMIETFLVFGEGLSKYFQFGSVKLIFIDEESGRSRYPEEIYALSYSDFQGVFDRSIFLKDKNKVRTHIFPLDQQIVDTVFKCRKTIYTLESAGEESPKSLPDFLPFMAQPVFIHKKIFAILIVMEVRKKDIPTLSILTERFVWEAQRVKLYEKVETLAITDGLTGVFVRRHLLERLEGELDRSRRFGFKFSFLMIDIDRFKDFNDHYGHLVGDVVLKQVAETIRKNVREIDLVGRYGGEEFAVLLIETDEPGALFVAERIRKAMEEKVFEAYDERLSVTISAGCSSYSPALNTSALIVDAADSALYRAKRQGRNRVCLSPLSQAPPQSGKGVV